MPSAYVSTDSAVIHLLSVMRADAIGNIARVTQGNLSTGVTFANLTGSNNPAGDVVIPNSGQTESVTVTGDSQLSILDATATTVNVIATGTASDIALAVPAATTVNISGSAHLTLDVFGANYAALTTLNIANSGGVTAYLYGASSLSTINAASSSGTNILSLASGQAYSGGSGQSIVYLAADDISTPIYGGTAGNNELVLGGQVFTAAGTGAHASGFTIAGFDILSTAGSYDVSGDSSSILKGITAIDILSNLAVSTSFTAASGSSLSIDAGGNSPIIYQAIDKNGATDSMTLTLGSASAPGAVTYALTLEDSASTPVGIGTVNLVSNGTGAVNSVTFFSDTALSVLNVSGNDGVTIAGSFSDDSAATLTISNVGTGIGALGVVTLKSFTDSSLATLNFAGSNAIQIVSLTDGITSGVTINDSNNSAVDIAAFGSSVAATTITVTNSSATGLLTIGDGTGVIATALNSLTLNGAVAFTLASDSVISGTTVSAGTDNADVSIALAGTAAGDTDNVVLGNGNDSVAVRGSGTENITLGNGGTAAAVNTVDLNGSTAVATVVVGTGMNDVTLGSGLEKVTFGRHVATASFYDMVGATSTSASFSSATTSSQNSVATANLDIVSGLVAGDKIVLPVATDSLAAATNLAGANGAALLAHGSYNASSGSFVYNPSGSDSLLTYDAVNGSSHPFVSLVLVGVSFSSAITESNNGTITLG
jgi:hypothetical protein